LRECGKNRLLPKSIDYNLEIATKKTKVFGFFETDHIRTKIVINNETLEQVSQITYSRLQTHQWTHYLPTGLDNLPAATARTNTRL
jgi:hypothetical protein